MEEMFCENYSRICQNFFIFIFFVGDDWVLFGKKKTLGRERTAVLFCVGLAGYLAWNLKPIYLATKINFTSKISFQVNQFYL